MVVSLVAGMLVAERCLCAVSWLPLCWQWRPLQRCRWQLWQSLVGPLSHTSTRAPGRKDL